MIFLKRGRLVDDLAYVKKKFRESGLSDGLNQASASEAAAVTDAYRIWMMRLAPYLLRDRKIDVATALGLYRFEADRARNLVTDPVPELKLPTEMRLES